LSRVEKLYDFIADQMVDQTEIVNRNTTRLHFMQNRMDMYGATQNDYFKAPTRFFLSNWIPPKAITKYLREVYGLSDGEVRPLFNLYKEKMGKIVLDRYPNIMGREKPSTRKRRFNESKMDRYVDYIINEFIENNIVEDEDEFTGEDFLSFKQGSTHLYLREPKLLHFTTDLTLDEFMEGDFGIRVSRIFREKYYINDYNKILLIWKKICGKLLKDYYGNQTINESTNKKNKFYDRIVDHFINTHCEISFFDDNSFNEYGVSFYIDIEGDYNEPWVYFANDLKNKIKFDTNSLYRNSSKYQRSFIYHLKNYGLTSIDEVLEVHLLIMKELLNRLEKLNKTDNINESEDRRERFINVIVDDLVGSTKIDRQRNMITDNPFYGFIFKYTREYEHNFPHIYKYFERFCKDRYGLTEDEIDYVWNQYKTTIKDKIDNKDNINESIDHNSKLEKLLDVMSDSFINKHYIVKVNQYYEYFKLILTRFAGTLFTDGDIEWVVTKELVKKWSNEYITWSEGYYEILKQDKMVDETPTTNAFDQTFVDHLHPLGIKDADIYQRFYKIVMNKLLELVIKDTEYYTNKGYKQKNL
jgi:hypothetical protein